VPAIVLDPRLARALEPGQDPGSPAFGLALVGAAVLHLFLLLAVSVEMPRPDPQAVPDSALEVLIVKVRGLSTETPAPQAALSQESRAGESSQGDGVLTTPADLPDLQPNLPAGLESVRGSEPESLAEPPPEPVPLPPVAPPEPQPQSPPPPPQVLTALPPPAPDPLAEPKRRVDAAGILASRSQEIARLTASLEARTAAYASRERRRSVSASTREFRYASYLAAWASKVERIGNLNYPEQAKERRIYGNLILHVAVRRDGSVEQIRVVRSSGYDLLDLAAKRIVELGAPYAEFPADIAAETDVLDIVRTWQFQRGGRLGWEN
jgi:protein TonB